MIFHFCMTRSRTSGYKFLVQLDTIYRNTYGRGNLKKNDRPSPAVSNTKEESQACQPRHGKRVSAWHEEGGLSVLWSAYVYGLSASSASITLFSICTEPQHHLKSKQAIINQPYAQERFLHSGNGISNS